MQLVPRSSGVPDLPEPRGKLSTVYDPSGAVIVCGGGETFWRPNANCWQLVAGASSKWEVIHQMFPVHGAASAFFKGKMWVFGGATGDDTSDHTITDKVLCTLDYTIIVFTFLTYRYILYVTFLLNL